MTVFLHSVVSRAKFLLEDTPSSVGAALLETSLKEADWTPESLDLVISCSNTPDFNQPGLVHCLLPRLKWRNADRAQCAAVELKHLGAGFFYGLQLGHDVIATGAYSKVAIVAVDLLTRFFGGIKEDQLKNGHLAARSWLADGAATCLLSGQAPTKGAAYRVAQVSVRTDIRGRDAFCCRVPKANRPGERLTLDDLKAGRHLPELDLAGLKQIVPELIGESYIGSAGPLSNLLNGKLELSGFGPGLEIGSAKLEEV